MPTYSMYDDFSRVGYVPPALLGPEPEPGFQRLSYSPPSFSSPIIDAPHINEDNEHENNYERLNNWVNMNDGGMWYTKDGRAYAGDNPRHFGSPFHAIQAPWVLPVSKFVMSGDYIWSEAGVQDSLRSSSFLYRNGQSSSECVVGYNHDGDSYNELSLGGLYGKYAITKGSFYVEDDDGQLLLKTDGFMFIVVGYIYANSPSIGRVMSVCGFRIFYWRDPALGPGSIPGDFGLVETSSTGILGGNNVTYEGLVSNIVVYENPVSPVYGTEISSYDDGIVSYEPFMFGEPVDYVSENPVIGSMSLPEQYHIDLNQYLDQVDTMGGQYAFDGYCFTMPKMAGTSGSWNDISKGFYVDRVSWDISYQNIGASGWRIGSVLGGSGGSLASAYIFNIFAAYGGIDTLHFSATTRVLDKNSGL